VKVHALALASVAALVASAAAGFGIAGARERAHNVPRSPPLTTEQTGAGAAGGEEDAGSTPQTEIDPLVGNGLGSPTCKGSLAGELSRASRRNCETSGFLAAPAPSANYGLDVHIDTGLVGLNTGGGLSAVQDIIVSPLWMGLVWAVHALLVMLEWCFTVELFGNSGTSGVGSALRAMLTDLTEPWLPIVLAGASVLTAYHGLIRRRVAETLGEVLVMGAMMAGGIWIIVDPTGTVGALGEWAGQASLGTLAVAARGTPARPAQTLAGSFGALYAAAIELPWCYLEFGNVGWCREPSQLDPRLRAAALRIAAQELAQAACQQGSSALEPCKPASGAQASALEHSAELLREARSNGAIFLALPPNGPARNSINEQGSLLATLCQSSEATNCRGPTAAQAEFRTNGGTLPRAVGLLLIAGGLLGMLLLLGFVAVRLLTAAIFSLMYLLAAPAMVLAPAFGERGRALFRRWIAQLLGAVISKLIFSFMLGVVFAVFALLSGLDALGFWTQWLLISAFWWGAYTRRHHALGIAGGIAGDGAAVARHAARRSVVRRMSDVLESRKGMTVARWAKAKVSREAPQARAHGRKLADLRSVGRERAKTGTDEQVTRSLENEHRAQVEHVRAAPEIQRQLAGKRSQLQRLGHEQANALAAGNARRAAELGVRSGRVRGEIEHDQQALNTAQRIAREGERAYQRTGDIHTPERRQARDRFLDEQAALPHAAHARGSQRRDYGALASLAGYGHEEYERLDPPRQRAARLEIDRELALRRELGQTARTLAQDADRVELPRRERRKADRDFDGTLQRRMQERGQRLPSSRKRRSEFERWREAGRAAGQETGASAPRGPGQSSVMHDAREVAARRKRQLGRDRP